jgi:hypothetical protein
LVNFDNMPIENDARKCSTRLATGPWWTIKVHQTYNFNVLAVLQIKGGGPSRS